MPNIYKETPEPEEGSELVPGPEFIEMIVPGPEFIQMIVPELEFEEVPELEFEEGPESEFEERSESEEGDDNEEYNDERCHSCITNKIDCCESCCKHNELRRSFWAICDICALTRDKFLTPNFTIE